LLIVFYFINPDGLEYTILDHHIVPSSKTSILDFFFHSQLCKIRLHVRKAVAHLVFHWSCGSTENGHGIIW